MTETWLPFAIHRPGPSAKVGYGSLKAIPLSEKEGEMKHSAEGSLAGAFGVLDNLGIQASWTGTIAKDGRVFQHYPLETITWHAGLRGDRRMDTSLIGNLTLNGWEHEGGGPNARGEPLTAKQYQATLRVSEFTRSVMPRVGSRPPELRRNLWEHNFVTPTACPSGRIPWTRLINDLTKEEVDDDMAKLIKLSGSGTNYITDGLWKWAITSSAMLAQLQAAGLVSGNVTTVSEATFNRIKTTHVGGGSSSGGITKAEAEALFLRILKRQKLIVS